MWYCQYYLTLSKVLCDVEVVLSVLPDSKVLCDVQVVVRVEIILDNGKTLKNEVVCLTIR